MSEIKTQRTPSVFDDHAETQDIAPPTSTTFQVPESMLQTLVTVAKQMNQEDPTAPQLNIGRVRGLNDADLNGPEKVAALALSNEVQPKNQRVVTIFEQPQLPK